MWVIVIYHVLPGTFWVLFIFHCKPPDYTIAPGSFFTVACVGAFYRVHSGYFLYYYTCVPGNAPELIRVSI